MFHKKILLLADIEGSSECLDYESTRFMGKGWPRACRGMTRDVNAVVRALFDAGVTDVIVKDFHRTGYNLFKSGIDSRANLVQGYKKSPVPGIGHTYGATGLIMTGMHAPSGSDGFLAHTLTSRITQLIVNGEMMSEAQLFAASLSPFELAPLFISGCPAACTQAAGAIEHLNTFSIDNKATMSEAERRMWREELGKQAARAASTVCGRPYLPKGPFNARLVLKGSSEATAARAARWGWPCENGVIRIQARDIHDLYAALLRMVYFTPVSFKMLPALLPAYHVMGRAGLAWARRQASRLPD